MERHFHTDGITVNKTIQTIESVAVGAVIRLEVIHNPALLFRCVACRAL